MHIRLEFHYVAYYTCGHKNMHTHAHTVPVSGLGVRHHQQLSMRGLLPSREGRDRPLSDDRVSPLRRKNHVCTGELFGRVVTSLVEVVLGGVCIRPEVKYEVMCANVLCTQKYVHVHCALRH